MAKFVVEIDVDLEVSGSFEVIVLAEDDEAAEKTILDLWNEKKWKELGETFPRGTVSFNADDLFRPPEDWEGLEVNQAVEE